MIRVLMLDLGDTLIHGNALFPHAREALDAISGFDAATGESLATCLVSDFRMPMPPPTHEKIDAIFQDFLSILDHYHLREFFEPVSQRVTLSTHAGVLKPDRQVFETAISRLGLEVALEECLFITENRAHISKCQKLGMDTLHFGKPGSGGADFSNWSDAPLLVARLVAPRTDVNLELALKTHLAACHDIDLSSINRTSPEGRIHARGKLLCPICDPNLGVLDGVHVGLPVEIDIQLDGRGRIKSLQKGQPSAIDLSEAIHYLQTLVANQQVSFAPGQLTPGATHQVEVDAGGRRRLTRKRYSAI